MTDAAVQALAAWAKTAMSAPGPVPPPDRIPTPRPPRAARGPGPAEPTLPAGAPDAAEPAGGYARVPFLTPEHGRPLQRVVARAADASGLSHFVVNELLTRLAEGIADEVARGQVVRVPGFGMFAGWRWEPKRGGAPRVYPRFVAARAFRQQVRDTCPPGLAQNAALRTYQRSHHPASRPEKAGSHTWTAMHAWRQRLRADPAYDGSGNP